MNSSLPTYILIALICVCATILGAMHVLPSEAVTAILGGAIAQAINLVRADKGGSGSGGGGASSVGAGTALGMLLGAFAPYAV